MDNFACVSVLDCLANLAKVPYAISYCFYEDYDSGRKWALRQRTPLRTMGFHVQVQSGCCFYRDTGVRCFEA